MELPVIRKDVRCYWQSKSLSSVQVKKSINFFDLDRKRNLFIIRSLKCAVSVFRESFSFLLLKYTHKQTESKHKEEMKQWVN